LRKKPAIFFAKIFGENILKNHNIGARFQIEKETLTISDEEMIAGMRIIAERMKLVKNVELGFHDDIITWI
jgi:hypothetical protein